MTKFTVYMEWWFDHQHFYTWSGDAGTGLNYDEDGNFEPNPAYFNSDYISGGTGDYHDGRFVFSFDSVDEAVDLSAEPNAIERICELLLHLGVPQHIASTAEMIRDEYFVMQGIEE